LVATFGAENVTFQEVPGFEEFSVAASVVYPNDPKRRLEFLWRDEKARSGLGAIWIDKDSQWTGPLGVRLGMRIDEVESLNTTPFKLSGFDWDYGGMVTDWQGGAMTRLPGGCRMSLMFIPDPRVRELGSVVGETQFLSNNKDMRGVKPMVARIFVNYK
jgi:hypothetical protein